MKAFIGLDIGTSAAKGVLMTCDGMLCRTASAPFEYIVKGDGRFLDPAAFCEACFGVIKELASGYEVAAVCSCHASGNLLLLDGDGMPVTPIVGWQTRVPQEDLDRFFTKEEQAAFYRRSGWPLCRGMAAAVLTWLNLHRPELIEKAAAAVMSAEYMNFKLTGKWGVSVSMATPGQLIDQEKGEYHLPLLEKLGVADKFLPPIFKKGTVLGTVLPDTAARLGLSADTAVVLGSFDHPSGALGAGVLREGELLLSCGTSWVELFPVCSREFGLSTGGLVDKFTLSGVPYCVMKSLTSVTEKINARREAFFGQISHKEFDGYIAGAAPGCGGLRLDFTENDFDRVKGYGKENVARAVIEGAALMLKDNLAALRGCGLRADRITAIGGITNSPVCTRVISEVLEQEIAVVNGQSAGAVGSCLLAGIGTGVFRDENEAFEVMKSKNEQNKY